MYFRLNRCGAFQTLLAGICIALLVGLVQLPLHAQSDTGRIVGTVTDATGAAIPGAVVTITETQNGLHLHATSNAAGDFNIFAVPRGQYTAKVDAQGFQSQIQPFTLTVTQVQTLLFKLQPGAVSTTVKVTGAAPLIDSTNATLGETIQGKQITQLPLNGRNFTNLALLAPGVTRGAYGDNASGVSGNTETLRYNESGGAALSINGLRPQANNYILDGVDNNDGLVNTILFFPPVDATQEFKIDTSVAPAQFGRAGGGIIVSSIKSGTNSIHGSAFEFYRSGKFDANPNYRFLGAPASPNPAYNRNQFGGSAGLPIIKNKLFLFGDYSGWREALPVNAFYVTVPTAKMRMGDFSELLDPSLTYGLYFTTFPVCVPNSAAMNANQFAYSKGQIYDPTTCQPFAGNIIPPDRLNPAAVNYLNAYPLPSRTDRLFQNYYVHETSSVKYNTFDTRMDWHATPRDLAFFRFSYDNTAQTKTSEFPNLPAGYGTGVNFTHARGYDLGYTHIFTPNTTNEAHLAYNRDNYGYQPPMYGDPVSAKLGIVNANRNLETSGGALIGGDGYELEYTGDYGTYTVPQNTYEVTDTVDWQHGAHSFKFGGTFIRRQVSYFSPVAGKGFFAISSGGTGFTGYEPSELLVGAVGSYTIGSQTGFFGNISQEDGLFAQDDWRVNQRLTVNLGIRWDLLTWPYEMHNRQAAFDIKTGTVLLAGQNGVSRSIINQNYHNFGPRLGFAYDLRGNGRTVLRGGYGIYYFPDYGGIGTQLGIQPPFGGSSAYLASNGYCITFTGQTATQGAPYSCPVNTNSPAVTNPLPQPGFVNFNPAAPPLGLSIQATDRGNKNSQVQEWNLQLEQQVGTKNVFDIAYVGTKGTHLSSYYNYNDYQFGTGLQNYPKLGSILYNVYNGISNYNSLQLHAEHRESNLIVTGSFAWAHTLDDSTGIFQSSTIALYYDPKENYGNSNQDRREIFSSSVVYELPFGRGQRYGSHISRPLDWAIGGWQTNIIALLGSGQPTDLSTGALTPGNRPDQISDIRYEKSISGHWFDPSSFSSNIPAIAAPNGTAVYTRLGTARRNQVFGPGTRTVDLGLQKNVHLTDRVTLELHGDAFNVLNTPQFTAPNGSMNNPSTFGKVLGVQNYTNRQIQLAGRLTF